MKSIEEATHRSLQCKSIDGTGESVEVERGRMSEADQQDEQRVGQVLHRHSLSILQQIRGETDVRPVGAEREIQEENDQHLNDRSREENECGSGS